MKFAPTAALAFATSFVAAIVYAQAPAPRPAVKPAAVPAAAPIDPKVAPASTAATLEPTPYDQIKRPTIALPDDPIDPFLLTKENGPFMVLAKTFRGPDAERYALVLVLELRNSFGLPAYILRTKDFPGHSNIRNVPPTAPPVMEKARLTMPEKVRSYDEAAVLIGNELTEADAMKLMAKVKKLHPKCLDELPDIYGRHGLKGAIRTVNPYVPTQKLFPGKRDNMVMQMNQGPHSVYQCPGKFALEIADFSGRSTLYTEDANLMPKSVLKQSPLATAHDDAERLANALMKAPEIQQTGQPVYVYHSRTASKVFIGSFNAPDDPNAAKLRENLLKVAYQIMEKKDTKASRLFPRKSGVDKMIAPASFLTDVESLKPQ